MGSYVIVQWTEIHLHVVDMHERYTYLESIIKAYFMRHKTYEYGIIFMILEQITLKLMIETYILKTLVIYF